MVWVLPQFAVRQVTYSCAHENVPRERTIDNRLGFSGFPAPSHALGCDVEFGNKGVFRPVQRNEMCQTGYDSLGRTIAGEAGWIMEILQPAVFGAFFCGCFVVFIGHQRACTTLVSCKESLSQYTWRSKAANTPRNAKQKCLGLTIAVDRKYLSTSRIWQTTLDVQKSNFLVVIFMKARYLSGSAVQIFTAQKLLR